MNILTTTVSGSRLYGTSTETSDFDYKGVYLPTLEDCLLLRSKDSISVSPPSSEFFYPPEECDSTYFSLQRFVQLAAEGQSVALEMLFADEIHRVHSSSIWESVLETRSTFVTKKIGAFMGFAKSMASKYAVRADRYQDAVNLLEFLLNVYEETPNTKLAQIIEDLPTTSNLILGTRENHHSSDKRIYTVLGREYHVASMSLPYFVPAIQNIVEDYGKRVTDAAEGRIDFKSISHAFRVAYQCQSLVRNRTLEFPLKEHAGFLKDIKEGRINYLDDGLSEKLDALISEVEKELSESDLPESVPQSDIDEIVLCAYSL